jgi:putative phosphoesterase
VNPERESLNSRSIGVIADAHVHPGKTPPLPDKLGQLFSCVDLIVALGDMGEASALDALEKIATLKAVAGGDDAHGDPRLRPLRMFSCGSLHIGAVFDGALNGLFESNDPLVPVARLESALTSKFGLKPDVLLCASTHKPFAAWHSGVLIVNPGSPTLADTPSVSVLDIDGGLVSVRQLSVQP